MGDTLWARLSNALQKRSLLVLLVFVVAAVWTLAPPIIDIIDARFRYVQALQLLQGRLDVPYEATWPQFYVHYNEETYSIYGLGQALLLIPCLVLGKGLGALPGLPDHIVPLVEEATTIWVYLALINALVALATFGILRTLGTRPWQSACLTIVLFMATPWLIWGLSMQEEGATAAFLLLGTWMALRAVRRGSGPSLVTAGLMFGFCASFRPAAAFAVLAVLVWLLFLEFPWRHRLRWIALVLAGSAPSLILFFWWNCIRSGSIFTSGWAASGTQQLQMSFRPELFLELLGGLNLGVLWFAPLLLLTAVAMRNTGGRLRIGLLATLLVGSVLIHASVLSFFQGYVGKGVGVAWGPRYLMHGVILAGPLLLFLALQRRQSSFVRHLVVVVLILSGSVQWAGKSFHPILEVSQDEYWASQGLGSPAPSPYLPRRFVNIVRYAEGGLLDYSYPGWEGSSAPRDFEVLATPELVPLRVAKATRSDPPLWLKTVVFVFWAGALVGAFVAALRVLLGASRESRGKDVADPAA